MLKCLDREFRLIRILNSGYDCNIFVKESCDHVFKWNNLPVSPYGDQIITDPAEFNRELFVLLVADYHVSGNSLSFGSQFLCRDNIHRSGQIGWKRLRSIPFPIYADHHNIRHDIPCNRGCYHDIAKFPHLPDTTF